MRCAVPGPESQRLSRRARDAEAPGINTLYQDHDNVFWQEAKGANVLDVDGNRYIDLTSGFGVAAIGHRHPSVTRALRRQGGRLVHGLGDAMGHGLRIELAERLQALAPVDAPRVYFAVSGADAVEVAIKSLLLATKRSRLLVFEPSYHGLTLGALNASSRGTFRQPFASHLHTHLDRLPFDCPAEVLEAQLRQNAYAGVLLEPIVGREGVLVPRSGWLRQVAELCRAHDVPLVADEIFTGFGRTGNWFAVEHEGVRPDLLCCGKALAGGLPIGAVIGRRRLMDAWKTSGEALHTATFVAHPLACATALATLDVIDELDLVATAHRLGSELAPRFTGWMARYSMVTDIRGRGLLWGIEMQTADDAARLAQQLLQEGLLCLAGGATGRVVQWVPPLTIHPKQLQWTLHRIETHLQHMSDARPDP